MYVRSNGLHIQDINEAKVAHMRWVTRAKRLVAGYNTDKDFIPVEETACNFGKWYYTHGIFLLRDEKYEKLMERIGELHIQVHNYYREIYDVYFVKPQNRSLLHKVATLSSKKISTKDKEKANESFGLLEQTSTELIALLGELKTALKTY